MRCRSYPKTTKPSITTPSTPSSAYGYAIGSALALAAPLLNVLGIWQAFVARRYGKRAIGGLLLNGLELCIFIGIVALIIMILSALSGLNDAGPSRSLNALMLYWN